MTLSDEERDALEKMADDLGERKLSRMVAMAILVLAAMSQGQRTAVIMAAARSGPTQVNVPPRLARRRIDESPPPRLAKKRIEEAE